MSMTQSPSSLATSQIITLPSLPELFDSDFLDVLIPVVQNSPSQAGKTEEPPPTANAMMDALRSTAHQKLTTNNAPAFNSTLVSTLDAYLGLRTGISGHQIDRYLDDAWREDPELTLRIIWSTRSIHDGKGEKELFYRAFGWLFENHPRTAISNLHYLIEPVCIRSSKGTGEENKKKKTGLSHGYWKDLLNILCLATVDELRPKVDRFKKPRSKFLHNYCDKKSRPAFKSNQEQEEWSRAQRIQRSHHDHDRLVKKLANKHYLALYVAVARLFADHIAKECDIMNEIASLSANATKEDRMALRYALTFVTKWAPTPGGSHDRVTNIASAICLLLHEAQVSSLAAHKISFSVATALSASDLCLLRCVYQQQILTRGRRHTCIPEPLMSSVGWSKIVYSRVPSICMNKNKDKFFMHDEDRFLNYLDNVKSGKKKISGATLLPHLLVIEALEFCYLERTANTTSEKRSLSTALEERQKRLVKAQVNVIDAQWAALLTRLRESGQLDSSIAICDVSGSMGSINFLPRRQSTFDVHPIFPALALSLLVARLGKPPFNDAFITFSQRPQFVSLEPESKQASLGATVYGMSHAEWGMNTDFNAVFLELILPLAVQHNVPRDQMIKRIFVFTDMQFDAANKTQNSTVTEWKTNHDVIAEAYAKAGYDVPELVYWDLSRTSDGFGITAPVTGEREGVALLSGYSPALLKVFMDVEEEDWEVVEDTRRERPSLTPEELMKKALGRKSFDGLVVVD